MFKFALKYIENVCWLLLETEEKENSQKNREAKAASIKIYTL